MLTSRLFSLVLGVSSLGLCLLTPLARAAGPATVSVRVEGLSGTLIAPTQVTTASAPMVKDGNSEHACSGTSALAALQLASAGNWSGPWNSKFHQYEIYSIAGESHLFEAEASANYYWSFWLDEHEATEGACEAELQPGDRVLFFPGCFGAACPPAPAPLGIEAPPSANVEEAITIKVKSYGSGGEAAAVSGASIEGAQSTLSTDANGSALVHFSAPGIYTLWASAPATVRSEAIVCVHAGNDGNCGTTAPGASAGSTTSTVAPTAVYKGPFAVVAKAAGILDGHVYSSHGGPRVLAGSVLAHGSVSSVTLELRRQHRGRCSTYDGTTERFVAARCGTGRSFRVANGSAFSYLLPSALPAGRYVLDIRAADTIGNTTALARGTSRIVFYVR
ncbi:MAG: hypothetical protein H0X28_14060 [Solirubrobacterales bacterium]|nr:hypothetical protein [Solirubrobacterales bacterium]